MATKFAVFCLVLSYSVCYSIGSKPDCDIKIKSEIRKETNSQFYSIDVNVEDGINPLKFYWFAHNSTSLKNSNEKNQIGLKKGKYTLVVEDAQGCHVRKDFNL